MKRALILNRENRKTFETKATYPLEKIEKFIYDYNITGRRRSQKCEYIGIVFTDERSRTKGMFQQFRPSNFHNLFLQLANPMLEKLKEKNKNTKEESL